MKPRCDNFPIMATLKTTATVDGSRTLAVLVPQCGVEAGQYEVLVVLDVTGGVEQERQVEASRSSPAKDDVQFCLSGHDCIPVLPSAVDGAHEACAPTHCS